jgi:phytoene synthase
MADLHLHGLDFDGVKDFNQILTNPFLDIAARFWDKPRYDAFRVCYRSMRRLDDFVDDRKIEGSPITENEKAHYRGLMTNWLHSVNNRSAGDPFLSELYSALDKFAIPLWPWERLCRAMTYDLEHDGFRSLRVFLRYAEGAAIAPASVFMHLCGVQEGDDDRCRPPAYDIRSAARPLALFSYLVHIVRDFQKDQLRGLNYFADDFLSTRDLGRADLRRVAEGGAVPPMLRDLIGQYRSLADHYRSKARNQLSSLARVLEPRYRLSLEIIYGLYHLVFERIDPKNGRFTEDELNPSPAEVQTRLSQIVSEFKADNKL